MEVSFDVIHRENRRINDYTKDDFRRNLFTFKQFGEKTWYIVI